MLTLSKLLIEENSKKKIKNSLQVLFVFVTKKSKLKRTVLKRRKKKLGVYSKAAIRQEYKKLNSFSWTIRQ